MTAINLLSPPESLIKTVETYLTLQKIRKEEDACRKKYREISKQAVLDLSKHGYPQETYIITSHEHEKQYIIHVDADDGTIIHIDEIVTVGDKE